MPLRCVKPDGENVHSFALTDEQWVLLKRENSTLHHLRMPCCDAQVIFKQSARDTRFFAHKARGPCTSSPESEIHLLLKTLAARAASAAGWTAATEVSGISPMQEAWTADVLAQKGNHKVAIEVQWSSQTVEETIQRQKRYKDSGIRGLWLMRQPGFPITKDLPAVCIDGSVEAGFKALVPYHDRMLARDRKDSEKWRQGLPIEAFLSAVFEGRFQFGIPPNAIGMVVVRSGKIDCWRKAACGAQTRIIKSIDLEIGRYSYRFTVPTLGDYPDLLSMVLAAMPIVPCMGIIKRRYSNTLKRAYFSNGCWQCDALIGDFYERYAEYDGGGDIVNFPIQISEQWRHALAVAYGPEFGWGVHES